MIYTIADIEFKTIGSYDKVNIKVTEGDYRNRWISGFSGDNNKEWKVGQRIGVEIYEREKDGKTYINYKLDKEQPDPNEEPEKTPYEQGVEHRHTDRQSGMALGNAKTNATTIVNTMYQCGKFESIQDMKDRWVELVTFFYSYIPDENGLPF